MFTPDTAEWMRGFAIVCLFAATNTFAQVNVVLPWVRSTPQGQKSVAVYMLLEAHRANSVTLVAASSALAKRVEIRAKNRRTPTLAIPAGTSLELKPGNPYLLMTGLKKRIRKGERVPVTLQFETDEPRKFSVDLYIEVLSAHANSALHDHPH